MVPLFILLIAIFIILILTKKTWAIFVAIPVAVAFVAIALLVLSR